MGTSASDGASPVRHLLGTCISLNVCVGLVIDLFEMSRERYCGAHRCLVLDRGHCIDWGYVRSG